MGTDNVEKKNLATTPPRPEKTPDKDVTETTGNGAEVNTTREQTQDRLTEASESIGEKKQAIIIVCGPPHSGKSVFFTALKYYLPRRNTRLFRACPDGEGTFSQLADSDVAQDIRRKGRFTSEFIDFVLKGLGCISQKRVLVDVGGIRSPENAAIFRKATHAVVLCRSDKPEEKQAWEDFCKEHGVVLLASIDSSLTGEEFVITDENNVIRGQVVGLERGQKKESDVLTLLALQILEDTQETGEKELVSERDGMRFISFDNLADEMEVPSRGIEIRRQDKGYDLTIELPWWTGEKIGEAADHLKKLDPEAPLWLDGGHPATLYTAITAALPNKEIWYTDETNYKGGKGKVEILELSESPSNTLNWKVEERDNYTLIEVGWRKDLQWGTDNFEEFLRNLKIPQVNPNKGVIISGKMAYLIFGSMTKTYQNHAQWIGLFAPQQKEDSGMKWPAMVVASRIPEHQIGDYVDCPAIGQVIARPEGLSGEEYVRAANFNLEITSRTAQGTIDTSASVNKVEEIQIGLSPEEIAEKVKSNFTKAIRYLYTQKDRQFENVQQLQEFIENIARQINNGITKEGVLTRRLDSAQYPYTKVEDLATASGQFYEEFLRRLSSADEDSIALAAWVEYHIDLTDHFFADGCGKIAKAISTWVMMRARRNLPKYRSREELYENAPKQICGKDKKTDEQQWEKWLKYYKTLF